MMLLFPQWLWLLAFMAIYLVYLRRRGSEIGFSLRAPWLLGATFFVIIALARPVLPHEPVDVEQQGSDVIFAVDLSRSMQATDIAPSRLEAAKMLLAETVRLPSRHRFGVLAFTTNAIILSPLTMDDELLLHLFSGLDTSMVVTKGTELGGVLELARKLSRSPRPIVVLLTDGGDAADYAKEAAYARENGMIVNIVMLATSGGGTLKDAQGKMLRDEAGGIVVSSRNDAVSLIASQSGGRLIEGTGADAVLDAIESQSMQEVKSKTKIVVYRELFYYPLVVALLFAMLGMTDIVRRIIRLKRGTDA